jgi:hypothetical protein
MKKTLLIAFLLFFVVDSINAQSFYSRRRDRSLMFSFGLGQSTYHGDLHDVLYDGFTSRPTFGLGLRKKLGSQISVRLDLNWYQIAGSDAENGALLGKNPDGRGGDRKGQNDTRFVRNLSFRASNIEVSGLVHFNLIPVNNSYTRRPLINPYIFAGLGFSTNTPKGFIDGEWISLRPLNTELLDQPYSGMVMVIPLGLGVRLKANQYIDILIEGGRRFTRTDYLDDVSTFYQSKDAIRQYHLDAGSTAEYADLAVRLSDRSVEGGYSERSVGAIRGHSDKNDAYYIFQVRLEMYLPENLLQQLFSPSRKKPKFR